MPIVARQPDAESALKQEDSPDWSELADITEITVVEERAGYRKTTECEKRATMKE